MERFLRGVRAFKKVTVPGFREREQLQDTASRFLQIKKILADYGCRSSFSESRDEAFLQDPYVTTIRLVVPKQNFRSVLDLFNQVEIKLPEEDSMAKIIHYGVIGWVNSEGIISEDHMARAMNEREILIFKGRGVDDRTAKAFEIEAPEQGYNFDI